MPESASWDVISGPESGPVVLGIDFPAARRREAGFGELASRIGPGYRFMQTRPPAASPCQRLAGDAYVGPWIEGIQSDRSQVLAVLGYRTGGVYAASIAEGISRWQSMPKVILFDPQPASVRHLSLEFRREISSISSLLSDEEIERTRRTEAEISELADYDITDAAVEMARIYWELSLLAFERVGLGTRYSGKFIAPFDWYISWLSVAGQIDPGPVWRHSTAIVSSDYPEHQSEAYPVGRKIPFDISPADLLRSEPVAKAVVGLLESSR